MVDPEGLEPSTLSRPARSSPIELQALGADDWTRTSDARVFSTALYRLSYDGMADDEGLEPPRVLPPRP
jgi:hypothetical protein